MPEGVIAGADGRFRCAWPGTDPLYTAYHDEEWGRPVRDDNRLFEKLCLEGFQSGLSWLTILRKRENFRRAFSGFDIERLCGYTGADVERLMGDAGIVRHRGKIASVLNNAQRARELIAETGSLSGYIWSYAPSPASRPARMTWNELMKLTKSPESTALSKDLRKRGWSFVGPTTVYAFMQSMGLVNDHLDGCFCRPLLTIR
jgi:DNA-3-methyladenine glycosylase I